MTLQHLALVNGKTNPTKDPDRAGTACSQGYDDGQGGAIYMRDGNLTVIDCLFDGNQAAPLGPDTGGGAIYIEGSKHGALIVGSTFTNNSGVQRRRRRRAPRRARRLQQPVPEQHRDRPRRQQRRRRACARR